MTAQQTFTLRSVHYPVSFVRKVKTSLGLRSHTSTSVLMFTREIESEGVYPGEAFVISHWMVPLQDLNGALIVLSTRIPNGC